MKYKRKTYIWLGIVCLLLFALWTHLLSFVDVQAIGPKNSSVGFAAMNQWFHDLTGVHMLLYTITDWAGLVPVAFGLGFAVLGLVQWISRRHILKVDRSILALGVFYIAVLAVYLFFEQCVVNRRPVLINGYLEASYPSSTTLLVMCVMPTAISQLRSRMKNITFRHIVICVLIVFVAFVVLGRLISGVHWLTDIIGAALLSTGLVSLYISKA